MGDGGGSASAASDQGGLPQRGSVGAALGPGTRGSGASGTGDVGLMENSRASWFESHVSSLDEASADVRAARAAHGARRRRAHEAMPH